MLVFAVMFETQPLYIERLAVVVVMRLYTLSSATDFAWLTNEFAIANGI